MTNNQIIDIINTEVKKMSYITADVRQTKTGVFVAFKHEYTSFLDGFYSKSTCVVKEFNFHRIQKPEYIYNVLHNSHLYANWTPHNRCIGFRVHYRKAANEPWTEVFLQTIW